MLITRAALPDGRTVDIRCTDTLTAVAQRLDPRPGEDLLDAAGALVLPGLHDHHSHLRAAIAATASVPVGPPRVRNRAALAVALAAAQPGPDGWIRAIGYHDSVAGPLDAAALDALVPDIALRVQHRSGALWILNTAGLRRLGRGPHPDGRFHRDTEELRLPPLPQDPEPLSRRLASYGITGITDATPGQSAADLAELAAHARTGRLVQRLHAMAPAGTPAVDGITLGPAKLILDDTDLDLDRITDWIADQHRHRHPVAVHCVTGAQLVVTLAALRSTGTAPGDRIEHAAVVPQDCLDQLAEAGVTVVTQPNFVGERGDQYRAEIPDDDQSDLWRLASLRDAGVPVALSTDAPFGDPDPWAAIRAAVHRRTGSGAVLGARERVSAATAIELFCGYPQAPARPRTLSPGEPADLCVLSLPPAEALAELDSAVVAATVIAGKLCYSAGSDTRPG